MKKLWVILLAILSLSSSAQEFKDKIITLKNDTIRCRITLVNSDNIFYDIVLKNYIENEYISIQKIKTFILDKDSNQKYYLKHLLNKMTQLLLSQKQHLELPKIQLRDKIERT